MLDLTDDNGLVRIRATGKQGGEDYDRFMPQFDRVAAREPGTVPMVSELASDFAGWDFGGLWRDLEFDVRHKDSFGRIAIVGDTRWEEWGSSLFDPLFRAEMKFFEPSERKVSEDWARGEGDVA